MFLPHRASKKTSLQVAYVAKNDIFVVGNAFACVTQSNTLRSWVVNSGIYDHIYYNKSLLSNIVI